MNIAIINQGGSKYLFEVPESISLKEGEKVKCDTKRGITDGTVWADSVTTDEPTAKLIGKLLGAKFPLKSVVGKTVTSVEMLETEPAKEDKPKQKAVKLYCVKDYAGYLIKSSILAIDSSGVFTDSYGGTSGSYESWEQFKKMNPSISKCLVPLVSRPAKVGEWVYIVANDCLNKNKAGDVTKVIYSDGVRVRLKDPIGEYTGGIYCSVTDNYLVLDGYQPEPKYYSGKVVCVEWSGVKYTPGKVYNVVDGYMKNNFGGNAGTRFKTLKDVLNYSGKFIEFVEG